MTAVLVLGGINEDIVASVATLPLPGETVAASSVAVSPGGKGLNQAVAAARFGAPTALLGAVGDDEAGGRLTGMMRQAGVDSAGVAVLGDQPTGTAFISLSEAGENMIIVNAGANACFDAEALRGAMPSTVAVSLTQFEAVPEAIEALFDHPGAGVRILNAAPALVHHRALLGRADILIVNETELLAFAGLGRMPEGRDALASAARSLITEEAQLVIVTLGKDGSLLVGRSENHAVPGIAVPVADTVGAGDCFCGVFAAALAEGIEPLEALRWANAAAALSVGRRGAASSSPLRAEIEAFMVAHADT